ncbi:MAG: hypothetical protein HYZ57_12865 [Acidobacteria bacterium]|nr:hypothetical protein [Acidobacteriota bacterium]MBI3280721.1 hypothetical protein [Acidobacteriota bacterium]
MTRRLIFCVFYSASIACRRSEPPVSEILPPTVQDRWKLAGTSTIPAEQTPGVVRSLGVARAFRAVYRAEKQITVDLYEMRGETSAFELIQKWRQSEAPAFHKGRYFVTASGDAPESLRAFLAALERAMKP